VVEGGGAQRVLVATEDGIHAAVDQDHRVETELVGQQLVGSPEGTRTDLAEAVDGVAEALTSEPAGKSDLGNVALADAAGGVHRHGDFIQLLAAFDGTGAA
jgi:hypothetical protein